MQDVPLLARPNALRSLPQVGAALAAASVILVSLNLSAGSGAGRLPAIPSPSSGGPASGAAVEPAYGGIPLSFEPNRGQTSSRVKFLARGRGYTLFLTRAEAVISLERPEPAPSSGFATADDPLLYGTGMEPDRAVIRMRLLGSNGHPVVQGRAPLPGRVH